MHLQHPSTASRAASARVLCGLAALIVAVAACGSDSTTQPQGEETLGIPASWEAGVASQTDVGIENISAHSGKFGAFLHGLAIGSQGTFDQRLDATPFRGMRVKATAWVMESFLTNKGSFTVSVDAPGAQSQSSVSIPEPAGGQDDWHQIFVVFDVPQNTVGLTLIAGMHGSGHMYFDDVTLAAVDATTPLTASLQSGDLDSLSLVAQYAGANPTLLNASFESGVTTAH